VTRCVCEKIALCKCSPTIFCQNYYRTLNPRNLGSYLIYLKTIQS
jgi:hypothetical protein